MSDYQPALDDLLFLMDKVIGYEKLFELELYAHADVETAVAALREGARFTAEVAGPINAVGDRSSAVLGDDGVVMPEAFKNVYRTYVDGGWPTLDLPLELGGQQLPHIVQAAFAEMLNGACAAFAMLPCATRAAAWLLHEHGDGIIVKEVLPRLVSGEWGATICITEAEAGSDVGRIRTNAVDVGDGQYRITGSKVFISYADHDLTPQIVHMALARTAGSAPGTRGLSLFAIPKRLIGDGGNLGESNAAHVSRVEPKMGLKASPTCVLDFENALGYRVGAEGAGLKTLFTMANLMRMEVAIQGVGVAGAATQQTLRYAEARPQGGDPAASPTNIIDHADVRRMLYVMRARTETFRALILETALNLDLARAAPQEADRQTALALAEWLLPICKAGGSDAACEVTNLAVQVYGGHGYISENGVEQYVRDSRVFPIYEGTNGIQALDLVTRKLIRDGGRRYRLFVGRIQADLQRLQNADGVEDIHGALVSGVECLESCTKWLMKTYGSAERDVEAAATPYLQICALVGGGWMWLRMAHASTKTEHERTKHALADFYGAYLMPEVRILETRVKAGASIIDALDSEALVSA